MSRPPSFELTLEQVCIEKVVQNLVEINNIQDLFNIVINIMEFYEKYRDLSGPEKLDKVKKMILLVMLTYVKDDDKRRFYQDITPMLIEFVIEISKRQKLLINVLQTTGCASCFKFSQ